MNRIACILGDITSLTTDAIVNAANTSLMGGGGVDGAIHHAGGPQILEECMAIRRRQGGCPTGEAVITGGGNMKTKYVIHTVGPVWNGGDEKVEQQLSNAYTNSLKLAVANMIRTIAFPNISTGIYGFPRQRAGEIAIHAVLKFLDQQAAIEQVIFCCFDTENKSIYDKLLASHYASR